MMLTLPTLAAAADPAVATGTGLTFDWLLLVNWIVAVGLPLLVGLVTTRLTSSLAKALLLAGLNALVSIGTELARALSSGTAFDVQQAVFQLLTALAIAWGAYGQFWKPTGVAAAAQASGRHAASSGTS